MDEMLETKQEHNAALNNQKRKCHESIRDLTEGTWPAARLWVDRISFESAVQDPFKGCKEFDGPFFMPESKVDLRNYAAKPMVDERRDDSDNGLKLPYHKDSKEGGGSLHVDQ